MEMRHIHEALSHCASAILITQQLLIFMICKMFRTLIVTKEIVTERFGMIRFALAGLLNYGNVEFSYLYQIATQRDFIHNSLYLKAVYPLMP